MRLFLNEPTLLMRKQIREIFSKEYPEAKIISIPSLKHLNESGYYQTNDLVISGLTIDKDWNYREWVENGQHKNKAIIFLIEKIHATNFFLLDTHQSLNISVLLKEETESSHLIEAVDCCLKGQVSRSSYIQTLITKLRQDLQSANHFLTKLSPREIDYLKLYCATFSPSEIALRMNISVSTVNSYKDKVLLKFNLSSVHELIQVCAHDELMRSFIPKPAFG